MAMKFSYEKSVDVNELEDTQELYKRIITRKSDINYLKKLMVMKGLLKE